MRILFLTQYFPPEVGAAQNRIAYFAKHFVSSGHDVTVLTAMPSYPQGRIFDEYQGKWILEEQWEGMRVVRVRTYVTRSKATIRRLMNFFSFVLTSVLAGICKCGKQDVVVLESPPLFLGMSGLLLKFVKKAKLALNVADLWLDSAVAMGIVRNRIVIRTCGWLEKLIYSHSELITGQTRGIVEGIESHAPGKPVALITNGAEIPALSERPDDVAEIRKMFGWGETFVVGYVGTHGMVHGLDTVLEAANLLAEHKKIRFVLFGDGTDKERLVALAQKRELKNVAFYPPQPRARILEILRCFDVALVPVRGLQLFRGALPSKMFEVMGAGIPVVASLSGEAQVVIEEACAGICVPPEDCRAVADAILQLFKDAGLRAEMGASGRRYILKHFNRKDIADKYERLLVETASRRRSDIWPIVAAPSERIPEKYSKASESGSGG